MVERVGNYICCNIFPDTVTETWENDNNYIYAIQAIDKHNQQFKPLLTKIERKKNRKLKHSSFKFQDNKFLAKPTLHLISISFFMSKVYTHTHTHTNNEKDFFFPPLQSNNIRYITWNSRSQKQPKASHWRHVANRLE